MNGQLHSVAVPRSQRGFASSAPDDQAWDLSWADSRLTRIEPVATAATGIVLGTLVDIHVHLDKSYTVDEVGAARADLKVAIERTRARRDGWSEAELHRRMTRALDDAWRGGTRALRTHLDWWQERPPTSLQVFNALCQEWRGRLELQFVSLTPLDLFEEAGGGDARARAVADAGGILGAFVYRNDGLEARLRRVFEVAVAHDLDLDFHVDEGLDADASGLRCIADLTAETGWQQRVTCGHACSLSVQSAQVALDTLRRCAAAGIHLVALPTTNLYLQGAWDATPVQRGITRLREAASVGVRTCIATDNVADAFYPYGSYDLLETFGLGVQMAHLASATDWLPAITVNPAQAMRLAWDGRIDLGSPADLIVLDGRSEYEMLTPRGRRRTVYRNGAPIAPAASS